MTTQNPPLKSVVILGGGTAGWMTAASLSYRLKSLGLEITLIESAEIGTIGVGEATVPAIKNFFASLDFDISELMKATNASFKLGIEFENWAKPNHSFFHPFGRYGVGAGEIGFQHLFQILKNQGENFPLKDYSLATQIAYENRFGMQDPSNNNDFGVFDWALHFDAGLFARYLRNFAEANGVKRIEGTVTDVSQNDVTGEIEKLTLNNGIKVAGELFVDCSGLRALLLQGKLQTGFNDWRKYLACDRAVAIGCAHKNSDDITPYTRSRAQSAGWTWRIPLQNRIGNGYVYCSEFISDDEALAKLKSELDGAPINEPNFVKYTTGHAKKIWNKNVVAIGLSAGFLEPLESTSITLIQIGIDKLIKFWPHAKMDTRISAEYNRISALEYEKIRDFIILHYKLNERGDDRFWKACREMEIPESLHNKIALYKACGQFAQYEWESFFDPSWHCMYEGFGVDIENLDPRCALMDVNELKRTAQFIREDVKVFAKQYPSHAQFIKANCAAPKS